jgi:cob(I)alamin adenosyltransferase
MRVYTGKGDAGTTDLLGSRVGKDDPRIEAIGALDEASSAIGFARASAATERTRGLLLDAQRDLYKIMAELAYTSEQWPARVEVGADRVEWLERETDALTAEVLPPRAFIIPGDTLPGAALDVARTVARRSERETVAIAGAGYVANPEVLRYLNRLSSLLFALARYEDHAAGATPSLAKTGKKSSAAG